MPLTKSSKDGIPYTRPPDIDAEIAEVLATEPSTWLPDALKSETLVYLIRRLRELDDKKNLGRLLDCLARRLAQIARDFTSGMNRSEADDFVCETAQEVNLLIFARPPNRKSEFLEIAFREGVRQRAINLRKQRRQRMEHVLSESSLPAPDPPEDGCSFIESHEDDDKQAELLVLEADQIRRGLAAVTNPLHREAVVLHFFEHWPIASEDPDIPTLSTRFRKTGRQIQNWIKTAINEMRAALGDIP
jgi:DNA-directed RNA polymerase specialized sigma24 family protein